MGEGFHKFRFPLFSILAILNVFVFPQLLLNCNLVTNPVRTLSLAASLNILTYLAMAWRDLDLLQVLTPYSIDSV